MEELTPEQIIENCLNLGTCEIVEQEIIPNSNRTRITKALYTWEGNVMENTIEYVNSVTSNSVYAVKNDTKELI